MALPLSRHHLSLLLGACLYALSTMVHAEVGIAVIVARDAPPLRLNRAMLRDIYLKKIFVDERGRALIPVNLPPDHALRLAMSHSLFHESDDALQRYWNERYFHGVRPPYVLGSQNAVLRFVAHTAGAIGYVAACRLGPAVRKVMVLPVPASQRPAVARLCDEAAPLARP
jgi:ABC-type phosphate transport system substrate-binding protein